MNKNTMMILAPFLALFLAVTTAKPLEASTERASKQLNVPDDEVMLLAPLNEVAGPRQPAEDMALVPVGPVEVITKKSDDGEILETANTMVFMPLFAYRRIQSQRRRVYSNRRPSYYYNHQFPTLA